MNKMVVKENQQMEQSPNEMDMTFQLETPVISQEDPELHEHAPTVSAAAKPSLVNGCNKEGFGGEVSQDSDSESSSLSSSCSSSPVFENTVDDEGLRQAVPFKTKDEILLEQDLPAVEELTVSLPDDVELMPVGTVSGIIQQLVIIQSVKDSPPLTDDSIIFGSDRVALGKVFEVFGPVCRPLYILRFNCPDELSSKGLTLGLVVYCAPEMKEYTGYILLQQLKLLKGSDASWKNDQEPPEEALDYSDDEKEQQAKRRVKNHKKQHNSTGGLTLDTQHHLVTSRYTGSLIRDHNVNDNQPPFCFSHQRPLHTNVSSGFHAPLCIYPPDPPSSLTFPPCPPPSFFSASYTSQLWQPNSVPFSKFPPFPPPQ
ncbi:H/ACA ribonucleoprotein complex non-core subunit NAF1 isoform X2 [Syngnathoides biaculeatus]|uniref:H/ACA ribonucleoprotein complex non-core subunit NAF1 isoform X2 n=1 Tax=Syngnathoides biaculeatus TaxID=300417 RepID=UPI002ADD820E|nr:H/ACA ribonucleoprotein complex non-core subunit NAF1 isoform X2 [Syngnathoides biaculeatus]